MEQTINGETMSACNCSCSAAAQSTMDSATYYAYMVSFANDYDKIRYIHVFKEPLSQRKCCCGGSNYLNSSTSLTLIEKNHFITYTFLTNLVATDREQLKTKTIKLGYEMDMTVAYEWEDALYLCQVPENFKTRLATIEKPSPTGIWAINPQPLEDIEIRKDLAAWRAGLIVEQTAYYSDEELEEMVQSAPFVDSLYQWYFYSLYNSRVVHSFPLIDTREIAFAAFEELWHQVHSMPLYVNRISQAIDAECVALGYYEGIYVTESSVNGTMLITYEKPEFITKLFNLAARRMTEKYWPTAEYEDVELRSR